MFEKKNRVQISSSSFPNVDQIFRILDSHSVVKQLSCQELDFVLNEGVGERMIQGYPFRWIKCENLIKEILELSNFLHLIFRKILIGDELLLQVPGGLDDAHRDDLVLWNGIDEKS